MGGKQKELFGILPIDSNLDRLRLRYVELIILLILPIKKDKPKADIPKNICVKDLSFKTRNNEIFLLFDKNLPELRYHHVDAIDGPSSRSGWVHFSVTRRRK